MINKKVPVISLCNATCSKELPAGYPIDNCHTGDVLRLLMLFYTAYHNAEVSLDIACVQNQMLSLSPQMCCKLFRMEAFDDSSYTVDLFYTPSKY